MPDNLPVFYPDLNDARFAPAWWCSTAFLHQHLAAVAPGAAVPLSGAQRRDHTWQGNRNWSRAREQKFATPLIPDMDAIRPIVGTKGSDSMSLDNMVEGLVMGGAGLFRALRLVIPPAWQNVESMDADIRAFYEYNSMHHGAVGRPAGIVLTVRPLRRLHPRPQRPAPRALVFDQGPHPHHRVRSRRVADRSANVERKGRVKPGR